MIKFPSLLKLLITPGTVTNAKSGCTVTKHFNGNQVYLSHPKHAERKEAFRKAGIEPGPPLQPLDLRSLGKINLT